MTDESVIIIAQEKTAVKWKVTVSRCVSEEGSVPGLLPGIDDPDGSQSLAGLLAVNQPTFPNVQAHALFICGNLRAP